MLEVFESNFPKALADSELLALEDEAACEYYIESHENKVTKKIKERDAKYKSETNEAAALDKSQM